MLNHSGFSFTNGKGRFLAVGVLLIGLAGFGNTFFIGLFGDEIRETFSISHGEFGLIYTFASVLCGLSLPIAGRPIDRMPFHSYTLLIAFTFVVGILLVASAANILLLCIAFYLVRVGGPGLLNHLVLTATARTFTAARGKAVSTVLMGQPLSEALLPILAVTGIALIGWRETWFLVAGIVTVAIPAGLYWVRSQVAVHPAGIGQTVRDVGNTPGHWSPREVLRDWRFYAITFAFLWNVAVVSGLFFHQAYIAALKGWTLEWVAQCFFGFAFAKVAGIIITGTLSDRIGSTRMLSIFLLPSILGLAVLVYGDQREFAFIYFMGVGFSTGAGFTLSGTIWAEIYGITHLGAVRSMARSITFPAGALAPTIIGFLIDADAGLPMIGWGLAICMVIATGLSACVKIEKVEGHPEFGRTTDD